MPPGDVTTRHPLIEVTVSGVNTGRDSLFLLIIGVLGSSLFQTDTISRNGE